MKLQHLDVLQNDMGGCPVLLVADQLLVALHDVPQLVREVVLDEVRMGLR